MVKCPKCGSNEFLLRHVTEDFAVFENGKIVIWTSNPTNLESMYEKVVCCNCKEDVTEFFFRAAKEVEVQIEW